MTIKIDQQSFAENIERYMETARFEPVMIDLGHGNEVVLLNYRRYQELLDRRGVL